MTTFDRNMMLKLLRQLDKNWEGMTYDIIWDLCDVMRKGGHTASADIVDNKMQRLVATNLFNHEKTYEGIWDIYQFLQTNGHSVAADSLRIALENLRDKGIATKPELN